MWRCWSDTVCKAVGRGNLLDSTAYHRPALARAAFYCPAWADRVRVGLKPTRQVSDNFQRAMFNFQ